jgi:hypothetical protein
LLPYRASSRQNFGSDRLRINCPKFPVEGLAVSDMVIRCPQAQRPVPTGLTTDMIVPETLPDVDTQ